MNNCDFCHGSGFVKRGERDVACNHDGTVTFNTDPKRATAVALVENDGGEVSDYADLREFAETLEAR